MKKYIVYLLMIVLVMSVFAGCKKKDLGDNSQGSNDTTDVGNNENDNNDETESEDETGNEDETENSEDGNAQVDSELIALIKKIYEIKDPGLMLGDIPVDLSNSDNVKYYTGLSDISKVKEAVASETMIGSQAYSLVLAKLNSADDAESVANEMLKGIDLRKWICVEADDVQVVSHDDTIMLIMVSSTFKDTVTSQQIVDAFKEVCDGKLDIELKK